MWGLAAQLKELREENTRLKENKMIYAIYELEHFVSGWSTRTKAEAELKRRKWDKHRAGRFVIIPIHIDTIQED